MMIRIRKVRRPGLALRREITMHGTALERLRETGGFTLDIRNAEWVTEGFAVSVNPELTRTSRSPDVMTLATYASDHKDILTSGHGKVFGGWLDTESGITYLDVVTVLWSKEEALDLAVQHGELAIFDLGSGQEIRTGLVKA